MLKVGIERIDQFKELFKNKRVGLITNPTGVDNNFKSTINILNEKTNLITLYAPEHGVRGDIQAGVKLDDYVDLETGCQVYSLYGKTRKPTAEMLEQIDLLCFDIQDVGARYYTFIYTLAYAMMSAKENGKTFVVFDRPNLVGANKVEGNMLDLSYRSFVGYYPLPQRYGLTVGELAKLYNEEYKINCDLVVIEMENYQRTMDFEATKRLFVAPSPNIPTPITAYAYLATCLFEGTNVSEGRGTTLPFKVIGAPWLDTKSVLEELEKVALKGVLFRELVFTPTFSKHQGTLCKGLELYITNKETFEPVITGYTLLDIIREKNKEFKFLPPYHAGKHPMIDLLTGGSFLREKTKSLSEIIKQIRLDSKIFEELKERYHLYG